MMINVIIYCCIIIITCCREEQEKLNVWYGLLNLENLYGTQETLMKTFQDALKNNEQLPLYYKLAGMYQLTDKMDVSYNTDYLSPIRRASGQAFILYLLAWP